MKFDINLRAKGPAKQTYSTFHQKISRLDEEPLCFGKYKGVLVESVPRSYIEWCMSKGMLSFSDGGKTLRKIWSGEILRLDRATAFSKEIPF